MFTFMDLVRLTPAGLQVLLRAIDKEKLPLALKGAPEAIRNMFLSQLSERAAKMLRDDIAALGAGQAEGRGGGAGRDREHRQGIGSRRRNRNQHQQRRQDNRMSMIATARNAQTT